MRMVRTLGAAAAALAMVGMTAPASAQSWHGGWGYGGYRHHHGGVDGGDVLLGALLAGGIIAVAASASKPRTAEAVPYDAPPPPPPPPSSSYDVPPPAGYDAAPPADYDTAPPAGYDAAPPAGFDSAPPAAGQGAYEPAPSGGVAVNDPDEAADACAAAAQAEGTRYARLAHVGTINTVDPSGGTWTVRGMVELRDSYRDSATPHSFRCVIAGTAAPDVRIDGLNR